MLKKGVLLVTILVFLISIQIVVADEEVTSWINYKDGKVYTPSNNVIPTQVVTYNKADQVPRALYFTPKSAFSDDLNVLDFEDLSRSTQVTDQYYESHGIEFIPQKKQEITVLNANIQDEFYLKYGAKSGRNAIGALPVWPWTSKFVPMVMKFKTPKKRVGFYVGNGYEYGTNVIIYLRAYDSVGNQIGEQLVYDSPFPNHVQTFIGIESEGVGISQLRMDYGRTNNVELIDDVITQDFTAEMLRLPDLYVKRVSYGVDRIEATVCNKGEAKTSGFVVEYLLNGITDTVVVSDELRVDQCGVVSSRQYFTKFQVNDKAYPVRVKVDPKDYILEHNDNNNLFILSQPRQAAPVIPIENKKVIQEEASSETTTQYQETKTTTHTQKVEPQEQKVTNSVHEKEQKNVVLRFFNWVLGRN